MGNSSDGLQGKDNLNDKVELKYLNRFNEPTNDEYEEYEDTHTGKPARRQNRLASVGDSARNEAVTNDPYKEMSRAGHPQYDAANREIRNDQISLAGEDPGRVFDAAGANSSSGFRHHSLPRHHDPNAENAQPSRSRIVGWMEMDDFDGPGTPVIQGSIQPGGAAQADPIVPEVPGGIPTDSFAPRVDQQSVDAAPQSVAKKSEPIPTDTPGSVPAADPIITTPAVEPPAIAVIGSIDLPADPSNPAADPFKP